MHLSARIYNDSLDSGERMSHAYVYGTYMGLGKQFFISPCGRKRRDGGILYEDSYWYTSVPYVPATYFQNYGENAIQFADADCNPEGVWDSPIATKRALAVTEGGQIINKVRSGNPSRIEWWMALTEPLK
jgi:hypothetical protein